MHAELARIADAWRSQRTERLRRRHLEQADFERLRASGLTLLPVLAEQGGGWVDARSSTAAMCRALRALAAADPSPALVSAMHPAVLVFWMASPDPSTTWQDQRHAVSATAAAGAQWGTVTSEPGSGGDIARTRTRAVTAPDGLLPDVDVPGRRYLLSGDKHFGSGTGVCSYMLTTAVPEGESEPAAFFLDTRALAAGGHVPGLSIAREWDGVGMAATQSHAVQLDRCPAVRLEWPGEVGGLTLNVAAINAALFTSVVLGIVDEAMSEARQHLAPRSDSMRTYERAEWTRADCDYWLACQAYDGLLRTIETGDAHQSLRAGLRCKATVAELAEQTLLRITRVLGGGTFSSSSPFSAWCQDVRALGFLRPPWGLAHEGLFATSF